MIIPLWPLSIKLDVLVVQIINVLILFFIFRKLFGKTLVEEIQKRKDLTKKLQTAETEYDALIAKAYQEKEGILSEALSHKQHLIQEALSLAEDVKKQTIAKAETQAQDIIAKAQRETVAAKQELMAQYESGVKKTASLVVEKIFHTNTAVQESYIDMITKEALKDQSTIIH